MRNIHFIIKLGQDFRRIQLFCGFFFYAWNMSNDLECLILEKHTNLFGYKSQPLSINLRSWVLESEKFGASRSSQARVYIIRGCFHIELLSILSAISLSYELRCWVFTIKIHQLLPPLRYSCKCFLKLPSFPTLFVLIGSYWQEFSDSNFHLSN